MSYLPLSWYMMQFWMLPWYYCLFWTIVSCVLDNTNTILSYVLYFVTKQSPISQWPLFLLVDLSILLIYLWSCGCFLYPCTQVDVIFWNLCMYSPVYELLVYIQRPWWCDRLHKTYSIITIKVEWLTIKI